MRGVCGSDEQNASHVGLSDTDLWPNVFNAQNCRKRKNVVIKVIVQLPK